MTTPLPYERREGESAKAFEAFVCYRDMGARRTLRRVGQELGKSGTVLERWSVRWDWQERAVAYDDHIEREVRKGDEKSQIRKLREFRIDQQRSAQTASRQALKALQKAGLAMDHLKAEDLKPSEAASYMQAAARLLESASAQQASALAVDEMLEALNEQT